MNTEIISRHAARLVTLAKRNGVHLTISTRVLKPLAMGNQEMVVDVRPVRNAPAAAPLPVTPLSEDFEAALLKLIDKVCPGLDTGDLLADAVAAQKALDGILQPAQSTIDLEALNKDLIDYRAQIARLTARIAELEPVRTNADGYVVAEPATIKSVVLEALTRIANYDSDFKEWDRANSFAVDQHYQRVIGTMKTVARAARSALASHAAPDVKQCQNLDELRMALCGIGVVGSIDGHDVVRRGSMIDLVDRRRNGLTIAAQNGGAT